MTNEKQTKNFQLFKTFMAIVLAIITILAALVGINSYFDSRIERAVNDEQFIRRVSSHVRPYVIFDATTIHKDGGAMEYLEEIEVEVTGQVYKNVNPEEKHDSHLEITITPKQYLAHAPLIESLGGLRSMIIYDGKRGAKYQWVYTVLVRPPFGGDIKTQKFRLEILR
ncbi:MAG: hypothetical protein FVQ84_03240 [Planctomycetes bacterium]|nr:hypothetical protein [Planctomycetota bacterium]